MQRSKRYNHKIIQHGTGSDLIDLKSKSRGSEYKYGSWESCDLLRMTQLKAIEREFERASLGLRFNIVFRHGHKFCAGATEH